MASLKSVLKKNGWAFDWKAELKAPEIEVYKLPIAGSSKHPRTHEFNLLGAKHSGGTLMVITPDIALKLSDKYGTN